MSNQALDLLIECELLKVNGKIIDLGKVSSEELSRRYTHFVIARQGSIYTEVEKHPSDSMLNAQFSTWSSKYSQQNTLSSLLTYNKIVLNDPLVSSRPNISIADLQAGLEFYSWLHPLIRAGFVTIYPIDYYERPTDEIPLLYSDDSFRSSISPAIHDFAHSNAVLKSVTMDSEGRMLLMREDASVKRRTALNVGFKNDQLYSGVGLFKFTTLEDAKEINGRLTARQYWDKDGALPKEKFNQWAYQATNQAVMARLKAISNQVALAQNLGHTYITESEFESTLLSLSNAKGAQKIEPCVKFLNLNDRFINIESPNTIIELRNRHPEAFERFNNSITAVSEELHGINEEDFAKKSRLLFEKEIMPQVDDIRSTIGQISSGIVKGTLTSFCGLSLAICTGSVIPLASSLAISAAQGLSESLPAWRELQLKKKRPSYIWHRLMKSRSN
ncbi:hypothetical protein [Pseudomonas sp. NFACC45]|uniref:hypothetical protein n=1 Tax=Pseudomonas sp. NFACC45 TaxID=1566201 RepID=UPI0008E0632B|nr:hypothetical protein [Pseudomonas sp. NFACC45]SFH13684.1 hypothetical protein SAMN03159297_03295 [Pseudomonas sp. NFACC45]